MPTFRSGAVGHRDTPLAIVRVVPAPQRAQGRRVGSSQRGRGQRVRTRHRGRPLLVVWGNTPLSVSLLLLLATTPTCAGRGRHWYHCHCFTAKLGLALCRLGLLQEPGPLGVLCGLAVRGLASFGVGLLVAVAPVYHVGRWPTRGS